MSTLEERYPEHHKLAEISEYSQAIGEFLETSGYTLVEEWDGEYVPAQESIQKILADYFGIDLTKIEAERREMLSSLREEKN